MYEALNFVKGAVARKDFVPAMTHFHIQGGRIYSYNGVVTLSSPIGLDLNVRPKAETFLRAISSCEGADKISFHVTPAGKLCIRGGSFKSNIECLQGVAADFEYLTPEAPLYSFDPGDNLMEGIKTVTPFISEDASRPWSRGILMRGRHLYATNNVILIRRTITEGNDYIPDTEIVIPRAAIVEMLRIKENPLFIRVRDTDIIVEYTDDRWMRAQLVVNKWPVAPDSMLDSAMTSTIDNATATYMAPNVYDAVDALIPHAGPERRLYMSKTGFSTHADITAGGASVEVSMPVLANYPIVNIDQLAKLRGVAYHLNMTRYPASMPFISGDGEVAGIIAGMRP